MVLPAIVGESCQEKRSCTTAQSAMTNPQLSQLSLNINCRKSCMKQLNWIEWYLIESESRKLNPGEIAQWQSPNCRNSLLQVEEKAPGSLLAQSSNLYHRDMNESHNPELNWMRSEIENWIQEKRKKSLRWCRVQRCQWEENPPCKQADGPMRDFLNFSPW